MGWGVEDYQRSTVDADNLMHCGLAHAIASCQYCYTAAITLMFMLVSGSDTNGTHL